MATLTPSPKMQFFDANGNPLVGGKLYTYAAGTTTPLATYTDSGAVTPNANPIILDSRGEASVWLSSSLYYMELKTSSDALIWTVDNIGGVATLSALAASGGSSLIGFIQTGTGSVPRTVQSKCRDVVSFNDFYDAGFDGSDITTELQSAINSLGTTDGIVWMPSGTGVISSTITIPSNVQLKGQGNGFGVYTSTVFEYSGNGIAFDITGYYSKLSDFKLVNSGAGTIGVRANITQFAMERVTIMPKVSTGFSTAGYLAGSVGTPFTHLLRDCYIYGNAIGADFLTGNNYVLDRCFIESNGTNIRIGNTSSVFNMVVCNGSVIELFGDGRGAETNTSISIDVVNCFNFVCRDSYFETSSSGSVTTAAQRSIRLRNSFGAVIDGNYMTGGAHVTGLITLDSTSRGTWVNGNHFRTVFGYCVEYTAGATFEIGRNYQAVTSGIWDNTWTPTTTNLVVVPGTGAATYSGTWERKGDIIFFTILISVTGTCTTASTFGNTYFAFGAMMPAPVRESADVLVSNTSTNTFTNGFVYTSGSGRIYLPTWAASNTNITITGSYQCASA